jgi:hypothetical protein
MAISLFLILPVIIISLALLIIAIVDLVKREYVRGGSKVLWALIIIFIGVIGPVVYILLGRQEKPDDSN